MVLYMILCGLLAGFVSTWFLFQHFPFREFLTPLLHDNTVQALGFVQLRVLVPLLTALLIASRNSAIISADLGHRVHSQQIDAMTNLSIPYHWYLSSSVVLNMVLASLIFVLFNFALSAWASMITWQYLHPLQSTAIWKEAFYGRILSPGDILFAGAGWVGLKMALSGLATGLLSIAFGMTKKATVLDLNRGIAQAIIWSTSAVLTIHAASALMEF
jgi:ABC-type transporter Mla maintaining outer membrane lipid asymmetry permease subunit MlaE